MTEIATFGSSVSQAKMRKEKRSEGRGDRLEMAFPSRISAFLGDNDDDGAYRLRSCLTHRWASLL
ncbi:hypothetical protein ABIE78_003657 [Sinorhizobium fredii]|uniref:Uncharacterized protein n=1 Tax=Sinorhizobium fredii (strain USDA 257) TaxID=1185652 RepID=I3X3U7_SINF2|nr:hypothetical protein [Sinorhizobium fredii]AFL50553.1 hypothetical protein USDA257_c19680 [Sinorhizobium fredii USDA 257]